MFVRNFNSKQQELLKDFAKVCQQMADEMMESANFHAMVAQKGWFGKSAEDVVAEASELFVTKLPERPTKLPPEAEFYAEYDSETELWGVFDTETGFCWGAFAGQWEAKNLAMAMNSKLRERK